jgi:dTDP-glucose pyrophosphorylase
MKKIDKLRVNENSTIREVLQVIKDGAMKIALVMDDSKLLGVIADSDIREGLLKDFNLSSPIKEIYNKNPLVCYEDDSKQDIIEKALSKKIQQIPILNDKNEVIGMEELDELLKPKPKSNKVVLMVGGLGTRLRPLTDDIPKPMLKVGGKPILETIVLNFKKYGFTNIVMCVNYKSHIIENHFKDGSKFGVSIKYVYEKNRMGTAGALSLLKEIPKEPFFVMNGDLLTNINLEHLLLHHLEKQSSATMCLRKYEYDIPYGVVNLNEENQIVSIKEKPVYSYFVNGGIYLINPDVLKYIPKNEFFDMPSLFEILLKNGKICDSYIIREYWLDIGRLSDYEKANHEYGNFFS